MLTTLIHRYIWPYRTALILVIALQITAQVASLYLPAMNAKVIDNGILQGSFSPVMTYGLIMVGATLVQVVSQILAVILAAKASMRMGRDIRHALMATIFTFSAVEMRHFTAPSLITRTTNDVQQIQMLVFMTLAMMVSAPLMMVGALVMALRSNLELSAVMGVCVAVLVAGIVIMVRYVMPRFSQLQERLDNLNRVVREQLMGIRVIRAFVREPFEADRFTQASEQVRDVSISIGHTMAILIPFMFFIMNASQVVIFFYALGPVNDGALPIGELTAFITYLIQILMSVMMSTMMLVMVPRSVVSARRIMEVLDTQPVISGPAHPVRNLPTPGTLAFNQVTFAYPGAVKPVLESISFTIEPGETLAVIGSTGSGKSSLVNLIARLFDVTDGQISLGGVDVRDLDPAVMAKTLSIVPQQAYLFSGTIASNLRYGNPEAEDSQLIAALETAQASQFRDQLDLPVTQGGTSLSGGQRQRIAIARALVANPDVYLFDDAFSALDATTDANLRAALARAIPHATKVIVAQRIATIKDADKILVLEAGRQVGFGTHDQLMATCACYQEIAASQEDVEVGS